jgi:hypothetical protein
MTLTARGNVGWLLNCRLGLGDLAASSAAPLLPVVSLIVLVPVPRIEQGAKHRHIHGHVVAGSGAWSGESTSETPDKVPRDGACRAGWAVVLYVRLSRESGFFLFARRVAGTET